ncbi:MAG: hypothetical protein PHI84_02220 [Kiritimatiellae bacterium]|nr:hypothetical protein [Kiritimatiellia bacterium]
MNILLFVAVLVSVVVLIWAVRISWKKREEVVKAQKPKQVLKFFAIILFVIGCVNLFMSIREAQEICAFVNGFDTKKVMFSNYLSSELTTFLIPVVVSGVMYLLSLTMPWNRKIKE